MKHLILISGTMGVGKTTTCRELQKRLPDNVFLDGDWCWEMQPFVVNETTKAMVMENICFLLNQFITCPQYQNIIFCWVMHEQAIIDTILSRIDVSDCHIHSISLIAEEAALVKRLNADVSGGTRTPDVIARSVARIGAYSTLSSEKIDVSNISAAQAAEIIAARLYKQK